MGYQDSELGAHTSGTVDLLLDQQQMHMSQGLIRNS